jgi:hypothetical protein
MRSIRVALVVVVLVVLASPVGSAAAARRDKPHCVVPRGWRLLAQNANAVVIRSRQTYPAYRYCARARGRFRHLGSTGPVNPMDFTAEDPTRIVFLQLKGRYIAYAALYQVEAPGGFFGTPGHAVNLVNALTGQRASHMEEAGTVAFPSPGVLLSPTGVVAWILLDSSETAQGSTSFEEVNALTPSGFTTLDNSNGAVLGDLQLGDCVGGCSPNTTVVVWTKSGVQHYADVTR